MKTTTADPVTLPKGLDDEAPAEVPTTNANQQTITALNNLITALLPTINKSIAKAITDSGSDPWKDVPVNDEAVLSINAPWPLKDMKVTVGYSITNMTGLSSLLLDTLKLTSISDPNPSQPVTSSSKPKAITGTLDASAKLTKNLVATVNGTLSASYGSSTTQMKISGKATAKVVTGTAKGTCAATMDFKNSCLTKLAITKDTFRLNYQDIQLDIQGDGDIADYVLNPVIDLIDAAFGDAIKSSIAQALEKPLNDLIKSLMPLCVPTPKPSK